MSVINLTKRSTSDWNEMHKHLQSTDSIVFVTPHNKDKVGPVSMDIEVGDAYILPGSNESFKIPKEGIKVMPKKSIVIYTKQRFKLPYNVFGVVTGKGKYIFRGVLKISNYEQRLYPQKPFLWHCPYIELFIIQ